MRSVSSLQQGLYVHRLRVFGDGSIGRRPDQHGPGAVLQRSLPIGELTGRQVPAERVAGSVAAHLLAAQRGARIVRVHDVAATVDALKVWEAVAAVPAPRRDAAPAIRWPDDD